MNTKIIQLLGFLIGLFISITLFTYNFKTDIVENFDNTCTNILISSNVRAESNITTPDLSNKPITELPFYNNKIMMISTFNISKISNPDQKWYENNIDVSKLLIMQNNTNLYFTYNLPLTIIPAIPKYANGVSSVNIKDIILKGPLTYNFSNTPNYELKSFTAYFILSINAIKNDSDNILLELLGNTNPNNITYEPSLVNINIKYNTLTLDYSINIIIGNVSYNDGLQNIDPKSFISNIINIGLIYNKKEIIFILNDKTYTYANTYNKQIILGTTNLIINKNGNIDANLYSFIYYNRDLLLNEIPLLESYLYYYITGAYYLNQQNIKQSKLLQDYKTNTNTNINSLQTELNVCKNNNNNTTCGLSNIEIKKVKLNDISPINIKHKETNLFEYISNMLSKVKKDLDNNDNNNNNKINSNVLNDKLNDRINDRIKDDNKYIKNDSNINEKDNISKIKDFLTEIKDFFNPT